MTIPTQRLRLRLTYYFLLCSGNRKKWVQNPFLWLCLRRRNRNRKHQWEWLHRLQCNQCLRRRNRIVGTSPKGLCHTKRKRTGTPLMLKWSSSQQECPHFLEHLGPMRVRHCSTPLPSRWKISSMWTQMLNVLTEQIALLSLREYKVGIKRRKLHNFKHKCLWMRMVSYRLHVCIVWTNHKLVLAFRCPT